MKYELSEDDVRAIHEARERIINATRGSIRDHAIECESSANLVIRLASRLPPVTPEPPKPVRYRLRECVVVERGEGDMLTLRIPGSALAPLRLAAGSHIFEPIPEEPAKVAGVFKRGDWVRRLSDGADALVVRAAQYLLYVDFGDGSGDSVELPAKDFVHCEAPR